MSKVTFVLFTAVFSLVVCVVKCQVSETTYDFIVVGGGAGGCAVARRLAENARFSVLLIESGPFPRPGHEVPANAPQVLADPEVTFNIQSVPQAHAALLTNGTVSITAGRMLGGGTSLNYLWYNRGSPRDWDNWASVTGDASWSYASMLKYFKRIENYMGDFPSEVHHGVGGPITVSRPRYSPGLEFWLAAAKELGYPIRDPNGPQYRSFSPVEYAKLRGSRVSSFIGYLMPVLNNPNLKVLINTNVTEIIFNGNRAMGVRLISNTTDAFFDVAYATKEVILSAGSYNSPLILQRSGIGPREILHAARIPQILELPVGLNFQDHPTLSLNFVINNANASLVLNEDRDLTPENYQLYKQTGDGPFSVTRGASGQAMISTSVAAAEGNFDWPDMQLCMCHSTLPYTGEAVLEMVGTRQSNLSYQYTGEAPISLSVFMGRPKSRGTVSVNPVDILGAPLVDFRYFTDPRDLQMFVDASKETVRIFEETSAYRQLQARYNPLNIPACDQYPVKSDPYWACYVSQALQGGTHPAGTNKMGNYADPNAVVDTQLRLLGMENLRIADASIIPILINANPTATVYAIAEKAAEMILNRWSPNTLPLHIDK